jgi:hypothetical protein
MALREFGVKGLVKLARGEDLRAVAIDVYIEERVQLGMTHDRIVIHLISKLSSHLHVLSAITFIMD